MDGSSTALSNWPIQRAGASTRPRHRSLRSIQTARGKFERGPNLLASHMKLFDDLIDGEAGFEIFEHSRHRDTRVAKNPRSTALSRYAFDGGALRPIETRHDASDSKITRCVIVQQLLHNRPSAMPRDVCLVRSGITQQESGRLRGWPDIGLVWLRGFWGRCRTETIEYGRVDGS